MDGVVTDESCWRTKTGSGEGDDDVLYSRLKRRSAERALQMDDANVGSP